MNLKRSDDKNKLYLSCHDYITNAINRVKKLVEKECLKTYDAVAKDNLESELDELPELDKDRKEIIPVIHRNWNLDNLHWKL